MKLITKILNITLYIIGMAMVILGGFFFKDYLFQLISIGSIILLIPWISCHINNLKSQNKNKFAWVVFLFFFAGIAVPVYLLRK
jgi:uncharacterized integral membrane protein